MLKIRCRILQGVWEMYGMLTELLGVQAQQNALQSLCWGKSLAD